MYPEGANGADAQDTSTIPSRREMFWRRVFLLIYRRNTMSFSIKPSLMPMVIAPDVWQSAVEFPADPQQVEERLGNLLLAVLLTLRTAGHPARKSPLRSTASRRRAI